MHFRLLKTERHAHAHQRCNEHINGVIQAWAMTFWMRSQKRFVPDDQFALLDKIVDDATKAIPVGLAGNRSTRLSTAKNDSAVVGQVLENNGFELFIPTDALSGVLWRRTDDLNRSHL
jgi:hypothetical protein